MAENKTQPTGTNIAEFLARVEPAQRREDALRLEQIFREVSGFEPEHWTGGIIGFGRYRYRYPTGRTGEFLATGFAPRKAKMSIYILPGYTDFGPILDRLGPHSKGRACLYITRLSRIEEAALRDLIRAGLDDLAATWPVIAT
ncbi:MAG: DUF1801 domain-containing protein [Pseudomonadota bacterium]